MKKRVGLKKLLLNVKMKAQIWFHENFTTHSSVKIPGKILAKKHSLNTLKVKTDNFSLLIWVFCHQRRIRLSFELKFEVCRWQNEVHFSSFNFVKFWCNCEYPQIKRNGLIVDYLVVFNLLTFTECKIPGHYSLRNKFCARRVAKCPMLILEPGKRFDFSRLPDIAARWKLYGWLDPRIVHKTAYSGQFFCFHLISKHRSPWIHQ